MDVKPLTKDELIEVLEKNRDEQVKAAVSGIKYFRLPTLYATPASGTVILGTVAGMFLGPHAGYVWSIRRLTAGGLGTGTSPDILNIYRNGTNGVPVWQLNGNNFGYTFGPTEMLLLPGENLTAASLGSLVATVQITLTGDAIEVPQEMLGKLVT
jgi:hypothetical protein